MNKPKISDFKNPRDFATACEKYAAGLDEGPADRADEDEERADEDESPAAGVPKLADFTDPRAYASAVEAWQRGERLDAKETTDATVYRTAGGHLA